MNGWRPDVPSTDVTVPTATVRGGPVSGLHTFGLAASELPTGGQPSAELAAAGIARGVARLLVQMGAAPLAELTLANARRADVAAIFPDGRIAIVEVKSSRADFQSDHKWPDYLPFADWFYFAVAADFPLSILPDGEGLLVADRWGAEILRPAVQRPLAPARRKAVQLRFARTAAMRLAGLADPPL